MRRARRTGPTLALSAVIAVSALGVFVGCGPPNKERLPSQTGGTTGTGALPGSGGDAAGTGGVTSSGGAGVASGGSHGTSSGGSGGSGTTGSGGTTSVGSGGSSGSGGATATGGANGSGGATAASGGATAKGGNGGSAQGTGGATASGGVTSSGGTTGAAGSSGTGGSSTSSRTGPCDIYAAANTPCAAAHSTVRALYGAYNGPLYQVRKGSSTKDITVLSDGYVDISVQDTFCSGGKCTVSIIYDQSPNKNDLVKSPAALWLPNGGDEVDATLATIKINGHTAHGIYVDNSGGSTGVGYRNNATKGLAKNDDPEAMYAVFDAKRYNQWCCFDYGNAEASGKDDGNATMEAIYFGNSTQWTRGGGAGPWVAADIENGMFEGDSSNTPSNTSLDSSWSYLTAMLKGPSGNAMGLKAGNAQSGTLQTKWNGKRPPGYSPKKLDGAIILGTGGDGSNNAKGTFYEGAITSGNPPDSVDDQIQANIVSAGYGR